MSDSESPEAGSEQAKPPPKANGFRLGRIFLIIGPVAVVLIGIVLGFGVFDGAKWISELLLPARVAASGQVMWRGKPMSGGEVHTQHETEGVLGAVGFVDEDGQFDLKTEWEGDFLDGAFVGSHKVTVILYPEQQTSAGTQPLTPLEYASFDDTPESIVITKSPEKNVFKITVKDDRAEEEIPRPRGGPTVEDGPPPFRVTPPEGDPDQE